MKYNLPSPVFSAMEPAASLTSVRVRRRSVTAPPSGKRGDLTEQQGGLQAMPTMQSAPAPAGVETPTPPTQDLPPPPLPPIVSARDVAPPAPEPQPLVVAREVPPEPLVTAREAPQLAAELFATREAPRPAPEPQPEPQPLVAREAPQPTPEPPPLVARDVPQPAPEPPPLVERELRPPPAADPEPLFASREAPAEPLILTRNMPAPQLAAPTPVEPLALAQPDLQAKLARLSEPAPVVVVPTPSLPAAEEREAALPKAEVMLPELAAAPPPEPVKKDSWAGGDDDFAWSRKSEEIVPVEAKPPVAPPEAPVSRPIAAPESEWPPMMATKPAEPPVAEQAPIEPPLLLSHGPAEPEPANEPKLNIPMMAAGPKAIIDLLSMVPAPGDEPAAPPAPPPVAVEPPVVAAETAPADGAASDVQGPDILEYWDSLRGMQDLPVLKDLDRGRVASTWANTVLLAFNAVEAARITRVGDNNGDVEYTGMVTDWILTRGRAAAKRGQPMEEEQRFRVTDGWARYRLLMLPFVSESGDLSSEHVLCHVTRTQDRSAVDSFKRWLRRA
jgi:hypothetical protein